jgi:hypothetical protein
MPREALYYDQKVSAFAVDPVVLIDNTLAIARAMIYYPLQLQWAYLIIHGGLQGQLGVLALGQI